MNNSKRQYRDGVVYLPNDNSPYTGEYTSYYKNGQRKVSGHYKNGLKNGIWEAFDSNGQLCISQGFKNNLKDGFYLLNHTLNDTKDIALVKGLFENDIMVGEWTFLGSTMPRNDFFDNENGHPCYEKIIRGYHYLGYCSGSVVDSKMSGLWECFTINGEIIESAFFDNGNQKNTKYYRNNEQVYTSTKYLVFTLFGAGLSVSAFAINYFFTNNLVFLWMIFYLILLVLLILIAPLFIPNKVGSYLKHLNAVMKCYSA